ncbi:O-acyltransferase [Marivirga tractuosa]|uniref:Membrane bound O-acyl transferase MBOAT family protein n=1 Tax=Marivirga tractuosa (strain ATCC 23168 / DSM 4126 / NBRC 15989 / NCIMB 1408 / VKM B-1430 / H-43) TaxID=643867 RepID=E4TQN7_MARTH|nr:MBOAT family O-acyltransferase [Marivirga tractuosa]ADR20598.1 membrane bound O-acyl transferase MBOAT family protein [Marivirga tractuosa DSM 4126]BDD14952.1 O-acyltransferase [Marivirga tractuosa]
MLFNSSEFALFLPFSFLLYWFVFKKHLKAQNFFLLAISYVFYGWWDWRFLSLIAFSSLVDFIAGQQIEKSNTKARKKFFLWISICTNLGFLGFFKYFNFFAESFADMVTMIGMQANPWSLNVILPVGISFYTFQTMSYTIDLYRGQMKAEKDPVAFFAYVSFFPQLVAGPIERAVNLLPQFKIKREFSYEQGADGMRLILWGLFKKVVIADNCAIFVNEIFANYQSASGMELILGAVFFAFQIYGDFSGYSDIAIGTAKLFGFNLMTNFRTPYFSRDMAEFWRRWHISLSTWFRDYVYIPLGGSRVGKGRAVFNTFVIFVVSGFWHGANWTFIIWGALNAIYFLPLLLLGKNRKNTDTVAENRFLPNLVEIWQMGSTFALTCLAWVFFRAETVTNAFVYIRNIFNFEGSFFDLKRPSLIGYSLPLIIIFWIFIEWIIRKNSIENLFGDRANKLVKYGFYYAIVVIIFFFGAFDKSEFIYFQF